MGGGLLGIVSPYPNHTPMLYTEQGLSLKQIVSWETSWAAQKISMARISAGALPETCGFRVSELVAVRTPKSGLRPSRPEFKFRPRDTCRATTSFPESVT